MPEPAERPIAPLELFFDLVFVFAFTQVTTLLADDPTWAGVGRALLAIAALWWAWAAYAWLTDTFDAELGFVWGPVLVSAAALFVAALAVPDAFGRHGVVFGTAFLVVNAMYQTLYLLGARGDRELRRAVLRVAPTNLAGSLLILGAGFVSSGVRPVLWLAALAVGLLAPLFAETRGWRVSPAHFVERHGLIVVVALGESLVAIGLGARHATLDMREIAAAVLGLLVAASLWLAYFDFFPIRGRQLLAARDGTDRVALARDLYSYLHLPMIAGIVLFAFSVKTTLAHVDDEPDAVEAFALCVGCALYLAAFVAARVRVSRELRGGRLVASIVLVALWPVATALPALAALAVVAAVWVALHAYELTWWRDERARTRAAR